MGGNTTGSGTQGQGGFSGTKMAERMGFAFGLVQSELNSGCS